jgi:RecJ-like exonuclease
MQSFSESCAEALALVRTMRSPVVMGHYDCDGLTSTSIVVLGLRVLGIEPKKIMTRRKIGELEVAEMAGEKEIITVDFGAAVHSQLAQLAKHGAKVLIIDHHQPLDGKSDVLQVNPHFCGIDGGTEISAAGTAYRVFEPVLPDDAIDLAIVGAVGDMQYPFIGENAKIFEKAERIGRAKKEMDLTLFGRVSRPLTWFLTYSTDVYLPGLTANQEACTSFLEGLGIQIKDGEYWRKYADLSEKEKSKLKRALSEHLRKNNLRDDDLIGEVYTFLKRPAGTELQDAKEFSTVLNACGRQSKPEIGIALCTGAPGAFEEARALLAKHRTALREGIEYAEQNVEDFGKFYFLDARGIIDDGIVGVVAGMLYSVLPRDKPIVAAALDSNGNVKVSARGTKNLMAKGINLGRIMQEAGGPGCGGHGMAAGANMARDDLDAFLLKVGKLIAAIDGNK